MQPLSHEEVLVNDCLCKCHSTETRTSKFSIFRQSSVNNRTQHNGPLGSAMHLITLSPQMHNHNLLMPTADLVKADVDVHIETPANEGQIKLNHFSDEKNN
jgi:hypothetical protein